MGCKWNINILRIKRKFLYRIYEHKRRWYRRGKQLQILIRRSNTSTRATIPIDAPLSSAANTALHYFTQTNTPCFPKLKTVSRNTVSWSPAFLGWQAHYLENLTLKSNFNLSRLRPIATLLASIVQIVNSYITWYLCCGICFVLVHYCRSIW